MMAPTHKHPSIKPMTAFCDEICFSISFRGMRNAS